MPRHNSRRPRSRRHYDRAYDEDLEEAYDDLDEAALEFDDSCIGRCCRADGGPDGHFERNRERARGIHRAFLANFGLAPREVPLLFYRCGPGGPDGGQPFTEATAPEGGCFEEDEGD